MEVVKSLSYSIVDGHNAHTYASEEDRVESGLIGRDRMLNLFVSGPFGDQARVWIKKRLGFGKQEEVLYKMKLRGSSGRAISVTDKEGFDAFEHLLARRPSAELQHAGVVDVTMMVDVKVGKVIDKSGESYSPAGTRAQVPSCHGALLTLVAASLEVVRA